MPNNSSSPPGKKTATVFYAVLLFVIAILLNYQLRDYGLVVYDEGFMVGPAHEINQGKVIYRDFFIEYPPGHFAVPAFLFRYLGENLLYERLLFVLIRSLAVMFLFLLTRFFVRGYAAFIPPLIFLLVPGPWHKSYIPFFTAFDLYFLCDYLIRPRKAKLMWLGLITALTLFFRQDLGSYFILTVLITSIFVTWGHSFKEGLRTYASNIVIYIFSSILFFSPVLFYFYTKGALMDFIHACFLSSVGVRMKTISFPFPHFDFVYYKDGVSGFFYYMPVILALVAALYILLSKTKARPPALLAVVCMGFLSFVNIWDLPDHSHLLQLSTPAYVLGTVLGDRAYTRLFPAGAFSQSWFLLKCAVVLGFLALPVYFLMSYIISPLGINNYSPSPRLLFSEVRRLNNKKAPLMLPDKEATAIERAVGFIDANFRENEPVLVIPSSYILSFLADRENYSASDFFLTPEFMSPGWKEALIARLAKDPPEYIIVDKVRLFMPDNFQKTVYLKSFVRSYPEMYDFITHNYSIYEVMGSFAVLKKGMTPASREFYAGALDMYRQDRQGALAKFREAASVGLPEGLIDYDRLYFRSSQ
jgi:hypothetical protein